VTASSALALHFRLVFAMLSQDQLRRLREFRSADPLAKQWIERLLDDRVQLTAVIQRLARHVRYLRARTRQAARYLDGLAAKTEDIAREPWPDKRACPRCGAAVESLGVDYRDGGHTLVQRHPDGVVCREKEQGTRTTSPGRGSSLRPR
jgi:hypothetical protein